MDPKILEPNYFGLVFFGHKCGYKFWIPNLIQKPKLTWEWSLTLAFAQLVYKLFLRLNWFDLKSCGQWLKLCLRLYKLCSYAQILCLFPNHSSSVVSKAIYQFLQTYFTLWSLLAKCNCISKEVTLQQIGGNKKSHKPLNPKQGKYVQRKSN